jgi:hypothetical protein
MKAAGDPLRYCWPVVARRFLMRSLTMALAVSCVPTLSGEVPVPF